MLGAVFSTLGAVFRKLKVGLFVFLDTHWFDRGEFQVAPFTLLPFYFLPFITEAVFILPQR